MTVAVEMRLLFQTANLSIHITKLFLSTIIIQFSDGIRFRYTPVQCWQNNQFFPKRKTTTFFFSSDIFGASNDQTGYGNRERYGMRGEKYARAKIYNNLYVMLRTERSTKKKWKTYLFTDSLMKFECKRCWYAYCFWAIVESILITTFPVSKLLLSQFLFIPENYTNYEHVSGLL